MSSRAPRRAPRPLLAPASPTAGTHDAPLGEVPTSHPTIHARAVSGDTFRWFAARSRRDATRTTWRRAS